MWLTVTLSEIPTEIPTEKKKKVVSGILFITQGFEGQTDQDHP